MKTVAQNYKKNILALEGQWEESLTSKSSIQAALTFLQQNCEIKHIYKQCGNKEMMEKYFNMWKQKKHASYSICYLAFHGLKGSIKVGEELVTLEELGDMLAGACQDRIIYFGSCKTLSVDDESIKNFMEATGALCVCGYETEINFVESSAWDLILLDLFQQYKDIGMLDKHIKKNYRSFVNRLHFKIVYK